jgi:hypothetical protein
MPSQNLTTKQKKHENDNLKTLIKENEAPSEAYLKTAKYEKITSPLYDFANTMKLQNLDTKKQDAIKMYKTYQNNLTYDDDLFGSILTLLGD